MLGIPLASDSSWKVACADEYKSETPRFGRSQGFSEIFYARVEKDGWQLIEYSDADWETPLVVGQIGGGQKHWIYQEPPYTPEATVNSWEQLLPRDIPLLYENKILPQRISGIGEVFDLRKSDETLNDRKEMLHNPAIQIAVDIQMPLKEATLQGLDNLLKGNSQPVVARASSLKWVKEGYLVEREANVVNPFVILDFGRQLNGYLEIEPEGIDAGMIDIGYSQSLVNGRIDPLFRGYKADRFIMRDGVQSWQTFMWRSFRYVQLSFKNIHCPIRLHSIAVRETGYAVEERGTFECSDAVINEIWRVATYTCRTCMVDAYMQYAIPLKNLVF